MSLKYKKVTIQFQTLQYPLSIMPPKCEDGDCCLPTSFTYNFKCGICCSVFHTREEKTRHNLLHFIPCTMCRETLRSRDHLLHHLKTVHEQKDLTHVKRHANNCKTYNLPVIPRPNRGPATKVEMVEYEEICTRITVEECYDAEEWVCQEEPQLDLSYGAPKVRH